MLNTALHISYAEPKKIVEKIYDQHEKPEKYYAILIVHYKHPLYDALDKARMLEKKAKNFGRDAVAVGHLTRRGSYSEAVFNWDIVPELDYLVWLIRNSKENANYSRSDKKQDFGE